VAGAQFARVAAMRDGHVSHTAAAAATAGEHPGLSPTQRQAGLLLVAQGSVRTAAAAATAIEIAAQQQQQQHQPAAATTRPATVAVTPHP